MMAHRNVLELLVIAVLLLALAVMTAAMLVSTAHGATPCRMSPDRADRAWWAYRLVEGKRCWYRGRPGRDKATLHWEASRPGGEGGTRELAPPKAATLPPALPEPPQPAPRLAAAHTIEPPPPLPVVQVQTLAVYRGIPMQPAPLSLPPLPYPKATFLEARSPLWLLTLPLSAIVLRILVVWFGIFVRRGVPA